MNPICLLTKGRTIKDMAERPAAYKLLAGMAAPKFASGRRLPARPAHAAPPAAQTSLFASSPAAEKAAVVETRKSAAPPVEAVNPPQPAVSKSLQNAQPDPRGRGAWSRTAGFCRSWAQRFVLGRKGRPAHGAAVQPELALEKVTVMRNDLNEDDLEVVLVERKGGTGGKPLARLSRMEMTGEAWSRLTAPFRKKSSENAFSPKAETKPSPELGAPV